MFSATAEKDASEQVLDDDCVNFAVRSMYANSADHVPQVITKNG